MGTLSGELALSCLRPASPASYTFREKRSEFIASLCPAATADEARAVLDAARRKHCSASHNCPAWRLGFPDTEEFCSDDGEPGGTAGRPILGCLRRAGVSCAVIVVTRYFGGVKLGVRGLIDAYAAAAEGALATAVFERVRPFYALELKTDYERFVALSRLLRGACVDEKRLRTAFAEEVSVTVLVPVNDRPRLTALFESYEARSLLVRSPRWSESPELHAAGSDEM